MNMLKKKHVYVPRESLDKILYSMWFNENDIKKKRKIWILGGAIARLGITIIRDKSGRNVEMFFIPETWYNWIKNEFETPF